MKVCFLCVLDLLVGSARQQPLDEISFACSLALSEELSQQCASLTGLHMLVAGTALLPGGSCRVLILMAS